MSSNDDHADGKWKREFDRYQQDHEVPYYPEFEHVAGAPAVGLTDKLYIDSGPEPRRNDATDHLFHK
jgi:hypothetical protein